MSATDLEQMLLPEDVKCAEKVLVYSVRSDNLVTLPREGRKLFYVYYCGHCQTFFPVLTNGTVSKSGTQPDFSEYAGEEAEVFLPNQIPGLELEGGKIVWENWK